MLTFEQNIIDLNFSFLTKEGEGGVILTENYEKSDNKVASPDILFAIEIAKYKFQADAVYFRYFEDGRAAVPQLYIYDYTQKTLTDAERNRIHIQMWSGYQVPAYIIIEKSSVSVFDSRQKPDDTKSVYAREIIECVGENIKNFQAQSFDDGLFWEEESNKKHFQFEQSAAKDLIKGLKNVFKHFQEKSNLDRHIALKLLVQSLLIKYLEERDEKSDSGYFAVTYFKKNFGCENFCDTIRKGRLLDLLDQLAKDFNGKIFDWDAEAEYDARQAISQSNVTILADYLDGKSKNNQYILWRLYSFAHLPVEVISSVYEELLTDSKDIVYTPEMIVSTLVDECMPLKNPQKDFKLIDVSCGSGIFLVKTYKRIVQWWRYEQWQKTGKLPKPSLPVLKELLLKSIHGIDIQQDAVRLAIFSLSLAILDEVDLDPPTWGKLRFPDLSENIVTKDFFEFISKGNLPQFDLVIGNPPFNLQQINGKEPSRKDYFKQLKQTIDYFSEIPIPDENPALHFLTQSMKLLKKDALLCFIQPSGPLFYQNDLEFKKAIFSKYNLLQVIDFTKIGDKIWGKRNIATAAIFMQNSIPNNEMVLHLVANRTFSNLNRLFLEFDHYDFHFVSKDAILSSLYLWKSNLLGGGRIVSLIERLSEIRTLGQFLGEKKKNGWLSGEGFIEKGDKNLADYITDQDFLPTEFFTETGIVGSTKCTIKYFHRPRRRELYAPPHLLIRKVLGKEKLVSQYVSKYLTFLSDIFAIHAPYDELQELINISQYIETQGSLLRFYILATSSRVKINKATSLYGEDILNIPYPKALSEIKLSETEEILLNDSISYFVDSERSSLEKTISKVQIQQFAKVFCKILNSVYETNEKSFQLFKVIDTGKYYALHFEYVEGNIMSVTDAINDLEKYINHVIPERKNNQQSIHIQKIMKIYGQDSIILVKPKQSRYWLPSIALRDADEVFEDYMKARYQNA